MQAAETVAWRTCEKQRRMSLAGSETDSENTQILSPLLISTHRGSPWSSAHGSSMSNASQEVLAFATRSSHQGENRVSPRCEEGPNVKEGLWQRNHFRTGLAELSSGPGRSASSPRPPNREHQPSSTDEPRAPMSSRNAPRFRRQTLHLASVSPVPRWRFYVQPASTCDP